MEIILDKNKRYTYADYLTWLDNTRRELLDGYVRVLVSGESLIHATISVNLLYLLGVYIKGKGLKHWKD